METINQFMVVCGWIITIGGSVGVLYKAYKHYKKPTDDLEQRITSIETDIKDIKQKLNSDYNAINSQQDDVNLVMKSMFNLIENKITGNNIDGLKKTRDELINALTTHEK
nr:MAG TPA: Protein of unknown function (DUF2730) [Caudoviricetes sp.]